MKNESQSLVEKQKEKLLLASKKPYVVIRKKVS